MSMLSNLDLIRRVPIFSMLTPAQAESLAGAVSKSRFQKGECVVEQGKHTNALYIILSGRARVLMTDRKGGEVILATLRSGDYIGEMSMIDSEPHSATVTAERQMDVLILGRDDFLRVCTDVPGRKRPVADLKLGHARADLFHYFSAHPARGAEHDAGGPPEQPAGGACETVSGER